MEITRADILGMNERELSITVGYHVLDLVAPPWMYLYYGVELSASRLVVDKMRADGWTFRLCVTPAGKYHAWFEKQVQHIQRPDDERPDLSYHAEADTEPLAICRAALIAKTESGKR